MRTLLRIVGRAAGLSLVFAWMAAANVIPDFIANDEETGQEYQREIACCTHPDGSWTAAWLDFRMGPPAIFMRSFSSTGEPAGPGLPLTDGYGLFQLDLNASSVGEPMLVPVGENRSLVVWTETREQLSRIQAVVVDVNGIVAGPVTVNDIQRRNGCVRPQASSSGDRTLIVWWESTGLFARAYGQVLESTLQRWGGNFLLHPEVEAAQTAPTVAAYQGGWTAAWAEGNEVPQIMARRFDLDGAALGDPRTIDPNDSWSQRDVALLSVADGAFLCWTATQQNLVSLVAREVDANLDAAGAPFDVYSPDAATVTPAAPRLLAGGAGAVLVFWTAGPASHTRIFSRAVLLPATPTGEVHLLEDPPDPVDGVLVPRALSVSIGDGTQRRVAWWDNREGWDLAYTLRADVDGVPIEESLMPVDLVDGTASQVMPAPAIYPNGRGIVVWEDFRTGGLSIFGRALDRDGVPEGTSFRVSEASTGSVTAPATDLRDLLRNRPSVATMIDGSTVVAWTGIFPDGRSRVYLQNYDPTGARLGGNVGLPTVIPNDPRPNTQGAPNVVRLADGGYMVVWRDTFADSDGDLFARRFLPDGTAMSDTIRIVDPGPYAGAPQDSPSAASSGEGEVIIAWIDGRSGDGDVYAQRLGPTGRRIERNMQISAPEEDQPTPQFNPATAAAPGRYVIIYDDDPLGIGLISGRLTILPSMKDGASARSIDIPITISTGQRGMKYPRVAMNPDGRFVVTYWDTSADSSRVMAQRYDPDGNRIGAAYSICAVGGEAIAVPGGVAANGNRIQYAFSDSREMRGYDARVRRVDWTFDGAYSAIALAGASLEERPNALILRWSVPLDRAGALYSVWRAPDDGNAAGNEPGPDAQRIGSGPVGPAQSGGAEYEFADTSVEVGRRFAYWIEDTDGEFAGPWSGVRGAPPSDAALRSLGNPFLFATRLAWCAPLGTRVDLSVHDAAGRRVRELLSGLPVSSSGTDAGGGEVLWDGRDESGRAVPAGVYWARLRVRPGGERSIRLLRLR
jgi:hypothetical protein